MSNEKFYTKNWFIICSLIFFFPLGLFLMWHYKKFTQTWRVGLTVFMCTVFIFNWGDSNETSKSKTQEENQTEKQSDKEEKEEKENNKVKEKPKQSEVERKAEEARNKIQADKKKLEKEQKTKEKEKQKALERRANAETIEYALLEKKADSYAGAYVRYEGVIGNIEEHDGETKFNLMTNLDAETVEEIDVLYVEYDGVTEFLDGDFVRIFGTLDGMYQYETLKRDYAKMPLIEAEFVEKLLN